MKLPTAAVTTHTLFRSSEFFECDWFLVNHTSHLPLPPAGGLLLLLRVHVVAIMRDAVVIVVVIVVIRCRAGGGAKYRVQVSFGTQS